jgi:hypothetical protein
VGTEQPRLLTVVSDARGRFELSGLRGGTWRFTVSAPGYVPQQGEEDISLRGKRPIEFRLPRMALVLPGTPAAINARQLQADLQAAEAQLRDLTPADAGYAAAETNRRWAATRIAAAGR